MFAWNNTKTLGLALGAAAALWLLPASASALDDFTDKNITLGAKVGAYVPSLFNDLDTHVDVALEGAWLMPFWDKRVGLKLEAGWSPPRTSGTEDPDSRLGEGGSEWKYTTDTQHMFISLGPEVRLLEPGSTFVPYIGLLARMYLIRTEVNGEANGNKFLKNTEESTEFGLVGVLGGELKAGPGAAFLELSMGWSDYPHTITGDTSTAALAATLGYRFFL